MKRWLSRQLYGDHNGIVLLDVKLLIREWLKKHHIGLFRETRIMDIDISSVVTPAFEGMRIDAYLAVRFTYHSRSQWQKEIRCGRILCDGIVVTSDHKKVRAGHLVHYRCEEFNEPAVNEVYSVLHEDDHIIAIDKPPDLPVHPAGIFFKNTLLSFLERDFKRPLYPIHRLDRETSGVILFGKSPEDASRVHRYFASVEKTYYAIVHGVPRSSRFTVDMPIGADTGSAIRKKRAAYPGAEEPAVTEFSIEIDLGEHALVRARPATGRQHQIRVHALYAGHPIVGDKMYGKDESIYLNYVKSGHSSDFIKSLEFPRSALHAHAISFTHPATGDIMRVVSPIPMDMKNFINSRVKID